MKRGLAVALTFAVIVTHARPAFAYLKFGVRVRGQQVTLKWAQTPVRYFISTRNSVPGVTIDDFQAALGRAFTTWQDVPTSSMSYQLGGFTTALPGQDDGLSTLGYQSRPELDRVLASTSFLVDSATGTLIESDIFFNSTFAWSVAAAGEASKFDLQTIALHEIGHMSGLGHSALGETEMREGGGRRVLGAEAVMFPIAFGAGSISDRTLKADDIAGISDIYPDGDFSRVYGSMSGTVTKDGQPIFGAHVVAYDLTTRLLVATFTLNTQGQFSIGGLSPGAHIVRVEPLDDADIDGFFDSSTAIDLDFRASYHDGIVVVPRGGDSGTVALKVTRK